MFTTLKGKLAGFALVAALGVAAPVAVASSASAEDCDPGARHDIWATPDAAYDAVTLNACSARILSDEYGASSGYTGVVGLITSWIPGIPAKTASGLFGVKSVSDFFVGNGLASCSNNFTTTVKVTFANGSFAGCEAGSLGNGGGMR
ncbi:MULTISPECIES: hypothetical protein [unclassified Plantibacter]|uniref:hypothetical protein n=1 Tax=unclassified Plantibacter TaxID=2624265 RepID=UPI0012F0C202|nr:MULTISPECIES: hypothetical protein [unclassified Plantibacter]MBF4564134.1 hypothetical protein [Plantibacter sp. VKM Ac-2876]VXB49262.1 exported hypothetical protein [Plantibacter sp. T3]